jgi:polynucleotide 5'-hydroxyl-kinase GRC3/NOL9
MNAVGIEVPSDWAAAIDLIASGRKRRVAVIGPTDSGKSSFIRAAMSAAADAGAPLKLIDLDPGQKMLGPPGTASLGDASVIDRFIFLGSTSASEFSRIVTAAEALADDAFSGFITNTSASFAGSERGCNPGQ